MKKIFLGYDCLQCFVSQIDVVLRLTDIPEKNKMTIYLDSLKFLSEIKNWDYSAPEIARQLYEFLYEKINCNNPFKEIKEATNELAEKVLSEILQTHTELTLQDYVKFAVAGNIIDFGVKDNNENLNIENIVEAIDNFSFEVNDFKQFYTQLKSAKTILYLLDNSGEAIFDRALIKKITDMFPDLIVSIAARNQNIINDISVADAYELGFGKLGNLISTGYNGPGIFLDKVSKEFLDIYNCADIVISKGQGNFESLYGENKNIFFALKIKCAHISKLTGFKLNSNLFIQGKK